MKGRFRLGIGLPVLVGVAMTAITAVSATGVIGKPTTPNADRKHGRRCYGH